MAPNYRGASCGLLKYLVVEVVGKPITRLGSGALGVEGVVSHGISAFTKRRPQATRTVGLHPPPAS